MKLKFSIIAKPQSNRREKPYAAAADDSPAIEFVTEFRYDEAPSIKAIAPIPNKKLEPQSNRRKKPSAFASAAAADDSPAIGFVTEFRSDEPPPLEPQIKTVAPFPNVYRPNRKLSDLRNLPQRFKSNGEDAVLQYELDSGSNPEQSEGYGLTLRQPPANGSHVPDGKCETISVMKLRMSRKDSKNLPECPGLDQFEDVPVEGFGAALFSAYGWKEDVLVAEDTKKRGRES